MREYEKQQHATEANVSEEPPKTSESIGTGVGTSFFEESGMAKAVDDTIRQIQELYLADQTPWVIGYSGGKDSTATVQLIWMALKSLETSQLTKDVHVITNDTLVENPVVVNWVHSSHDRMSEAAVLEGLPVKPRSLIPDTKLIPKRRPSSSHPPPLAQFQKVSRAAQPAVQSRIPKALSGFNSKERFLYLTVPCTGSPAPLWQ